MSIGVRPDIDTLLANLAKSFRLKASLHRQKAAEAQAIIDGFQGELYAEPQRYIIKQEIAAAEQWDARVAEAGRGYFLARQEDMNDYAYMSEFGSDMTACQGQGRCVYEATTEDQRIQQSSADAPAV